MAGTDYEFNENKIVQKILNRPEYAHLINHVYREMSVALNDIRRTFPNYTLHDIGHSVRVIYNISDILGDDGINQSSCEHLTLLVLASLLHDVGMVVTDSEKEKLIDTVNRLYSINSESEQSEKLAAYVREHHGERVKEKLSHTPANNFAFLMDIETEIRKASLSTDFFTQLVLICESHCHSCQWIIDNENLRKKVTIHRIQYYPKAAAVLLRLADILDVSTERAPTILLDALQLGSRSLSEWKRNIVITNDLKVKISENNPQNRSIFFEGECKDPSTHRYLYQFFDELKKEIQACNYIMQNAKVCSDNCVYFYIEPHLEIHISTSGFTSTKYNFKLNYEQITKLLMGEHLYGNRKAGLRELLQNAVDAVMLMKEIAEGKKAVYTPCIDIVVDTKENTVCVIDNGTGMSEEMLEKHFFQIGDSYYRSATFDKGHFHYRPIGHFGIGFLAYFMLSKSVILETKHYDGTQSNRIFFDRDLRYITTLKNPADCRISEHGTAIILNYSEMIPEVFENDSALQKYIQEVLMQKGYTCRLIVNEESPVVINSIWNMTKELAVFNENRNLEILLQGAGQIEFKTNRWEKVIPWEDEPDKFFVQLEDSTILRISIMYEIAEFISEQLSESSNDEIELWETVNKIEELCTVDSLEFWKVNEETAQKLAKSLLEIYIEYRDNFITSSYDVVDYYLVNTFSRKHFPHYYKVFYSPDALLYEELLEHRDAIAADPLKLTRLESFYVFAKPISEMNAVLCDIANKLSYSSIYNYDAPYPFPVKSCANDSIITYYPELPIKSDWFCYCDILLNGVFVSRPRITLHNAIDGVDPEKVMVNIKLLEDKAHGIEYPINVARDTVSDYKLKEIAEFVGQNIHEQYLQHYTKTGDHYVAEQIQNFIQKRYS